MPYFVCCMPGESRLTRRMPGSMRKQIQCPQQLGVWACLELGGRQITLYFGYQGAGIGRQGHHAIRRDTFVPDDTPLGSQPFFGRQQKSRTIRQAELVENRARAEEWLTPQGR